MSNSNPSINPANNDVLAGLLNFTYKKYLQQTDSALPAKVVSYDPQTNYAQIQPMIMIVGTDGTTQPRGNIAKVPVLMLGAGSFFIRVPVKSGDLGWIIANDRDISLFLKDYTMNPPNTNRIKNFSDCFFIPHLMKDYTVAEEDFNNLVIQNLDGSVKISLGENTITLKADTINIEGELIVSDRVIAETDFASGGNITAVGDITPHTPIPP